MTDTMEIEEYLAQGGVLTSPANVPARYRGELMRLMATFVDSQLAGAAGFADMINAAPGIRERIAAARIVADKLKHAECVLELMGSFGADVSRYANHHPWTARVDRNAALGAVRHGDDMRLSVFHYPLQGWVDAVVMNVLMGKAVAIQLEELSHVSYQPLAEAFRALLPGEARHADLGIAGLRRGLETPEGRAEAHASVAYWRPRVAETFGVAGSSRFEALKRIGLRRSPNEALLAGWTSTIDKLLNELDLTS